MQFKINYLFFTLIYFPIILTLEMQVSNEFQRDAFVSNILNGNVDEVIKHLDQYPNDIDYKNMSKETTLMLAIKSDYLPMVIEILNRTKKEKLEVKDNKGFTALMYCLKHELTREYILPLLLQKGANIESKDNDNCTPLIQAIDSCDIKAVELLLNNGASVSVYCDLEEMVSPLAAAINDKILNKSSHKKYILFNIIELLVKRGANFKIISYNGDKYYSCFYFSIIKGDFEVVKFLYFKKPDLNEKNEGKNLIETAKEKYENEQDQELKEERRQIYEFLNDPMNFLNDEMMNLDNKYAMIRANDLLIYRHGMTEDIADIITKDFISGPTWKQDIEENNKIIAFNTLIKFLDSDNYNEIVKFLDKEPHSIFLKDNTNKSPFLYAINKRNIVGISTILSKLRSLQDKITKEIIEKERTMQSAIPTQEDEQQLEKLKDAKNSFEKNLKEQFVKALTLANEIVDNNLINILNQYKKVFNYYSTPTSHQ